MISLAKLQRQFQQHVLAGDLAVTRQINASAGIPARTRLGIYADAYRLRLIDALGGNFPRLQQWLGDEAFAAIARRYIDGHPSASRSIRWYGAALPACLELSHPLQPWLADLAQWEWLIAAAFDGRDAATLDSAVLAEVSPDQWPTLRFEFHPSMRRIVLSTNAPALFKALAEESSAPEPQALDPRQPWLIWRKDLKTNYRSLDDAEAIALDAAVEGGGFEDVCDALCTVCAPEEVPLRAARLLKGWIADGLIVGVRAAAPTSP
jgi:Putative DNA-binding domain